MGDGWPRLTQEGTVSNYLLPGLAIYFGRSVDIATLHRGHGPLLCAFS